ncbi:MAG: hypothetical protein CFK48_00945, partial [Armatimonadetes bacterium CP1_7O]
NEAAAQRIREAWEARIAQQPAVLQPELRQRLEDDLRPLMQGAPFDRLELYLPWLMEPRACLLDYLHGNGWLVLDEPLMLNTAYERLLDDVAHALASRAERGDIPPLEATDYIEPFERIESHASTLLLGDPVFANGRLYRNRDASPQPVITEAIRR